MDRSNVTQSAAVPAVVRQRFGDQIGALEKLFQTNEDFREICLDFNDCVAQYEGLSEKLAESDPSVKEYRTLKAELEGEILANLAMARS